jgi:single-strand DNA-binding protein
MPKLNQLFLIGNLTRDPEMRYTAKGTPVVNCGIAVNEKWTADNGEKKEEVCFVDFTLWGPPTEPFVKFSRKGSTMMLQGRLKYEKWQKDDETRSKLVLVVEAFQFLDRKPDDENSRTENQSRPARGQRSAKPAQPARIG